MSVSTQHLGGRLPLFAPESLSAEQRPLYNSMNSKTVPWANTNGFKVKLDNGALIGPFNSILLSPAIATAFLTLQEVEKEQTSLSDRVRQVVILTVGAVWKCDYERYAHSAVALRTGLPRAAIQALAHGLESDELDESEKLAQHFTRQIVAEYQVPDELYTQASKTFGAKGIVDLLFLAGCYVTVSSLLNTFQVPAPQE